tara:strand:+ start:2816 stop:3460 length:645 start_codon:yes stop_codon:yes gene_type:complete
MLFNNTHFIIPARKGSKGLPKKNQLLLDYTISKIPEAYHDRVVVSTDDDHIVEKLKSKWPNCKIHLRSDSSAIDTASTKECLQEAIDHFSISGDIVMLYLTYPERSWEDITKAYKWFVEKKATSLLCREPLITHPFLCLYELDDHRGAQITEHDLYRRQDYPKCFKVSHVISIFKQKELKKLNKNLYNKETVYYKMAPALDVDTPEDYNKIKND